eukprot:6456373-Amphidinium_carterae.2
MEERLMEQLRLMDKSSADRLQGLEGRLSSLDSTLSNVNKLVQSFDKRLVEMENKVKELDALVQRLQDGSAASTQSIFSSHRGGEGEPAAKLRRSSSHPPSSLLSRDSRSTAASVEQNADLERARRTVFVSGFGRMLSRKMMLDYVKDVCALKNVFVQIPALYCNRCSIVFATREEAEVWLAFVKSDGLQHEGASLRASKGLTTEQKKRGYQLAVLKEKIKAPENGNWELCFKGMAVYLDGQIVVFVRKEMIIAGEGWPKEVKIEDVRALCREALCL